MQLQSGTLLQEGKYRIEKVLGQGGFGITYLATQEIQNRKVCIKEFFIKSLFIRSSRNNSIEVTDRNQTELIKKIRNKFLEEAQTLLIMKHPNIIKAYDIFDENGTSYYVMEFYDAGSLKDKLNTCGKINEDEAISYIRQICGALQYLHAHNRLHLDIKPGNIMLNSFGHAVLIDFGISKHYSEQTNSNETTLLGKSLGYAPIEQLDNEVKHFSPATDIYALGATLYKLVTGTTPPSASELLSNGLNLNSINMSCSIKNILYACMKPRKQDRPQNIEALLNLIDELSDSTTIENITKEMNPDEMPLLECDNAGMNYWAKGDYKKASTFFNSAWSRGYLDSLFHLALCYEQLGDYLNSTKMLKIASDKGHIDAMCQLAMCFEEGLGVPQNHRAAVKLCELAAKRGSLYGKEKLKGLDRSIGSLANYKALKWAIFWIILTLIIILTFILALTGNTRINYAKLINAAPAPLFTAASAYIQWQKYIKSLKY